MARRFGGLPEDVKAKYENEKPFYSIGWSHGKERLEGRPDVAKGSYYANPQYDRPTDDEALIDRYPAFVHPNIWPDADVPGFSEAFKAAGQLVVRVGLLVAARCDKYVESRCPAYEKGKLSGVIAGSKGCKARLLHYFPRTEAAEGAATAVGSSAAGESDFSDWCGWHHDHGSLTGLLPAMVLDSEGRQPSQNPDPSMGLYTRSRRGAIVKVVLPPEEAEDAILFQIGETAQIHSGGLLAATPHAVRGPAVPGISRETFAVFMQPIWDEPMEPPRGIDAAAAASPPLQTNNAAAAAAAAAPAAAAAAAAAAGKEASPLPANLVPLAKRWEPGDTFGDFTRKTFAAFY